MTGLEIGLLLLGYGGVAAFTGLSLHINRRRVARRQQEGVPVPELEARLQPRDVPLKVRVTTDMGRSQSSTRIVVDGVCARLTLRRELPREWRGGEFRSTSMPAAPELETGDLQFDAQFFILGPPTLVHAMLDAETRRRLRALTAYEPPGEAAVEQGSLRVDLPLTYGVYPQAVEERGKQAVALARRLLEPKDVARRLAENSQRDPDPRVRLRNLNAAVREDPSNPMTRALLRAAAADKDLEVRLRAALALGEEGREALLSLVEDPHADDASVETALEALDVFVPEAVLGRVLLRSVGAGLSDTPGQPRAARACLHALARLRTEHAVSRLQALLLANAFLAGDTARALGEIGGEEAEAVLVGALGCDVAASRVAAAKVLGAVGTIGAVPALREAERRGGELRRLAREAISDIQARVQGAPGAVSLAGAEAGQVSIAEDSAGRVSLPPGERAREP